MTIHDVRDYGAVADGVTNNAKAIQAAIDACADNGGGMVTLAGGTYMSGTIRLKSNVTLNIDVTTILLASPNIADYAAEGVHHQRYRNEHNLDRCFIYAEDAHDFAIIGHGEINGNNKAFPNEGSNYRPMMFRMLRCNHVRLEGIKMVDSSSWTCALLDSEYFWAHGIDIHNSGKPNGDGLDFDGTSHVYISDCHIQGTDDNICLQSSSKDYPVHDYHITNCELSSVCGGIRIGLKSIGDIHDVAVSNCTFSRIWREGIKIECTEGGSISDITVSNCTMRDVTRPLFVILNNRYEPDGWGSSVELDHMPEIGTLERLSFSNITVTDSEEMANIHHGFGSDIQGQPKFAGIRFDAAESHPIRDVTLRDLRYTFIGGVKESDIPSEYPRLVDKLAEPDVRSSENYWPDWSRTAFMDIRNVDGLDAQGIRLKAIRPDERPATKFDGTRFVTDPDIIVAE
ncbi:glycosyl hydrolase family 28 protein [Bifidobacterium sp. SO4]|uniref:glycoside hydrolase family 28 protein n=1 Tax=Bifidobacterium sp. SO4 TaxID=2809030 RepID=UPI001BDC531C|nr:glycosyl hydrolase family 28 protein [Bifidobacterium sp. SO4]MBT1170360.1 right-handed parallel beta-helix repeat-containing protein [Bifidobacterium sp. SO4]